VQVGASGRYRECVTAIVGQAVIQTGEIVAKKGRSCVVQQAAVTMLAISPLPKNR
jgi:hypothetical protein